MKKFGSLLLAGTLALALAGCGDSNSAVSTDNAAASGNSNGAASKPVEITYWYSWGTRLPRTMRTW